MQIRQLFGFCGGVIGVDRVGEQKQFLFVEYTYPAVWLILLQIPIDPPQVYLTQN